MFAYCFNNPVNMVDPTGFAPKWWESVLIGAVAIGVTAIVTAAVVTTGGGAVAVLAAAGKIAVGAIKIAATAGAISGAVRTGESIISGKTDAKDLGKDFVIGFADGFRAASTYSLGYTGASVAAASVSGQINNGAGWSSGKWEGGYQTPSTPGISIATYHGGKNGGRSFGLDMDIYNGVHYHTNKFGIGKPSRWIKQHHWELSSIFIGLLVGFSDAQSEW